MNLSAAVSIIKEFEGCAFVSYQDTGGVWTVGYGATQNVGPDTHITREEADAWLERDLAETWRGVEACVKVPLTEDQACALASFTYNVGTGNLRRSTLLKKLNEGDYLGAAWEFTRWNKDNGKVVAGLTRRRQSEQALFLSGSQAPTIAVSTGSTESSS